MCRRDPLLFVFAIRAAATSARVRLRNFERLSPTSRVRISTLRERSAVPLQFRRVPYDEERFENFFGACFHAICYCLVIAAPPGRTHDRPLRLAIHDNITCAKRRDSHRASPTTLRRAVAPHGVALVVGTRGKVPYTNARLTSWNSASTVMLNCTEGIRRSPRALGSSHPGMSTGTEPDDAVLICPRRATQARRGHLLLFRQRREVRAPVDAHNRCSSSASKSQ